MAKDLFGDEIETDERAMLRQRFVIPPFSILNAREGFWQQRKLAWLSLGIKSELGRGANLLGLSPECEDYA